MVVPETFTKDDVTYTVVGVADDAFANCDNLISVSLPATVTAIAANSFRGSKAIEKIQVAGENNTYQSLDEALYTRSNDYGQSGGPILRNMEENFNFNKNSWDLPTSRNGNVNGGHITAPIEMGEVTLTTTDGSTITRLWDSGAKVSFRCYTGATLTFSVPEGSTITNVILGMGATPKLTAGEGTLKEKEWTGNTNSIKFTATGANLIDSIVVKFISSGENEAALLYYPAAKKGSYTLPVKVTRIGDYAFEGTSLNEIVLSDSLKALGANSISSSSLTSLVAKTKIPATATSDPFTETNSETCKLFVPEGSKEAYAADQYWKKFVNVALGISELKTVETEDDVYYDLQGRRVVRPVHGIYIKNGKKVVLK
ncbi:leucine-rich repeat protein [Prevotella dentasini]|uniref:leucine-rich repeat protein n=1 Tax=Prevotella dentasini TaxID=589537 RepID=UPI00056D1C78|nr:leucine-rich repeat protein [Prevotella dentasini]